MPHRLRAGAVAALALFAASSVPATAEAAKPKAKLYVSVGDSYAIGYQPSTDGRKAGATRDGYANQLVPKARKRGHRLELVNFGCGGETTTSILQRTAACPAPPLDAGPGMQGRTQVAAAERFLKRHRGEVALVTVSIGGNDVTACARAAEPVPCVSAAAASIKENVTELSKRLRKAAGPKVRIVGLTYPDVIVSRWLNGTEQDRELAGLSQVAFSAIINPALEDAYAAVRGRFVDVTKASGSLVPLDQLTTDPELGTVPKAVEAVCRLTWICSRQDIHANREGYGLIADLVAGTLPRR